MWSHHLAAAVKAARRAIPSLGLASALALSTLGPPAPAGAGAAPAEPAARLQVVVKQVRVNDDHDWLSQGDMTLTVSLLLCPLALPRCSPADLELLARSTTTFGASSGETVPLGRVFPQNDELVPDDDSYAVYAGERYFLWFSMVDRDGSGSSDFEDLGRVITLFGERDGWRIGTHKERSLAPFGGYDGDYELEFEIRRAPLPDLRPVNIQVHDLPGSAEKLVCMGVQNIELGDAGPFEVALLVDGVVPPGGRANAGRLASGDAGQLCVESELPTSGQHVLAAVVDEPRTLLEFNETNNAYEQPYTPVAPAPTPTPTPSAALPDLTVSAIRFKSQTPDGKDDCWDGRNDVDVVFKNAGAADAGGFVVRLVVDGDDDQATDELVGGLEAGRERKIRLDNVRLEKGERALTATVDAKQAVAEAKEDNNELKITVRCKADD